MVFMTKSEICPRKVMNGKNSIGIPANPEYEVLMEALTIIKEKKLICLL